MATLGRDVYKIDTDAKEASQKIDSFKEKIKGLRGVAAGAVNFLTSPTGMAGGAMAGAFAAASTAADHYVDKLKESNERAENILNKSKTFGLSVRQYSGLNYGFLQEGASADHIDKFLSKIIEISDKADELKKIGLTPEDLLGKSVDEKVRKIIDAYGRIGDAAKRARIGNEQFGVKLFANVDPFIRAGSEGLDKNLDEARKYGLLMSTQDAEVIKRRGDAQTLAEERQKALDDREEAKRGTGWSDVWSGVKNTGRALKWLPEQLLFRGIPRAWNMFTRGSTSNPWGLGPDELYKQPSRYEQDKQEEDRLKAEAAANELERKRLQEIERQKQVAEQMKNILDAAYKTAGNLRTEGGLTRAQLLLKNLAMPDNMNATEAADWANKRRDLYSTAGLEDFLGRGVGSVQRYGAYDTLSNKFKTLSYLRGNIGEDAYGRSVAGLFGGMIDAKRAEYGAVAPQLTTFGRGSSGEAELINQQKRLAMAQAAGAGKSDAELLKEGLDELKEKETKALEQLQQYLPTLDKIFGTLKQDQATQEWN